MTDLDEARAKAAGVIAQLRASQPRLLELLGVDLGPALEQQLFFAFRNADAPAVRRRLSGATALGRLAAATAMSMASSVRRRTYERGRVVVIVRAISHLSILDHVDRALGRVDEPPVVRVRVGAAAGGPRSAHGVDLHLSDLLSPRYARDVAIHARRATLTRLPPGWSLGHVPTKPVVAVMRGELPRIGMGVWGLMSVIARLAPSALVCFDEKGTWARLIPAVGARAGLPSLDLPHAEASDPPAIRGAGYDRMAAFGPWSRQVLEEAGIDGARIVETGAPHFDPLIGAPPSRARPDEAVPRIVLASQYPTGSMTSNILEGVFRGAAAAAAAVAPSQLVVVPHPLEPIGTAAELLERIRVPSGVDVSLDAGGLRANLDDAWLVVTGWSNSIFEAALRGVPTLMVVTSGTPPVPYADEGLSLLARDSASAASMARSLRDESTRAALVERSRAALTRHLGPLDGRASDRTALLVRATSLSPRTAR